MLDLSLERETLRTLLLRHSGDESAWDALRSDGWLLAVCEPDGEWPLAGVALAVAETVGESGRMLAVAAHLAAASTLAEARDDRAEAAKLALVSGIGHDSDRNVWGDWWGPEDADFVVWSDGAATVALSAGDVWTRTPHPLLVVDGLHVCRAHLKAASARDTCKGVDVRMHDARAAFLVAAEAFGGVGGAVERTIEYLGQRRQFGATLATQQALQHRAVDMHLVRLTGSALLEQAVAGWLAGDGARASWQAKELAGDRGLWAAEQAVQLHGGIGFTWELGLHMAVRRSLLARLLLGGPRRGADEVLARVPPPRSGLEDWSTRFAPSVTRL